MKHSNTDSGSLTVMWGNDQITAGDLILRKGIARDRAGFTEIMTDPEVRTYLGGARPREQVDATLSSTPLADLTQRGAYVIAEARTDYFLGTVDLEPRPVERPGHVVEVGGELELSYVLRRSAWGRGIATRAARALLRDAALHLEDQPVLLVAQTANAPSLRLADRLGFAVHSTFEEFGAEQTLAVAQLASLR